MNRVPLDPAEPVSSSPDRAGSPASGSAASETTLKVALALAGGWAGERRLATILSGSHAAGAGVWAREEGRPVSLSDLDVYVVVPDAYARDAARHRAVLDRPGLAARLLSIGLAAPLEVGFHTPDDLARLPARPGTLDLRRRGRVVDGDPAYLERVPAWQPRDVSQEETLLLLENRGFELLWAEGLPDDGRPLTALRRRHAVLKCALDLASVMALSEGCLPEGRAEQVAWARARWDRAPEPPWDEALAWRAGDVQPLGPEAAEAERLRTVRAWVAVWQRVVGDPGDRAHPFAMVPRVARRARLRRRLRWALATDVPGSRLESRAQRMLRAGAGTAQHRLHAAMAALLILESRLGDPHSGDPEAARITSDCHGVLHALGVAPDPAQPARWLARAWDRGLQDGQRTEGWA